jgi:predicted amidohydrolase
VAAIKTLESVNNPVLGPWHHPLVLRGGTVIDASRGLNARADVAVAAGRIVELGATVGPGARTLDVSGRIVTPGLIDLHPHVATLVFGAPIHVCRVIVAELLHIHDHVTLD